MTIFGSSGAREGERDYEAARLLGGRLAQSGFTVCSGGYGGIMEAAARGAKESGGKTLGVTTEDFGGPANRWIDQEIKMKSWRERLFKLIELGDAYAVFDGGTGTLVELFIVWEMSNKKFLNKPIMVFGKQSQTLVTQIRRFPRVTDNSNIYLSDSPSEALKILQC